MNSLKKIISSTLLGSFVVLTALTPMSAIANETGKKHTTITMGAAAAALLLTHHTTAGVATAAGTAYAYSQYQREHQHNKRAAAYRKGYYQGQASRH